MQNEQEQNQSPQVDPSQSSPEHEMGSFAVQSPEVAPAVAPAQPAPSIQAQQFEPEKPEGHSSPGLVILQWLTYAFWGWALLAITSVVAAVFSNLIANVQTGEFSIYALAAVFVLLPAAFVCDVFYSRKEPVKKTGAAMAVMIIHAVIFALIGIGALITAVFTVVSMVVSSGGTEQKTVILLSAIVTSVFYAATFLRTLHPAKLVNISKIFRLGMLVSVLILTIASIVGPVAKEFALKDQKLIESNLGRVSSQINAYVRDNNKLPDSLGSLDLEGDAKVLIDKNLVDYKPEGPSIRTSSSTYRSSRVTVDYKYQLCVEYKEESSYYRDYSYDSLREDEYTTYVSAYSHPAGEVCYKVKATSYQDNPIQSLLEGADSSTYNSSNSSSSQVSSEPFNPNN